MSMRKIAASLALALMVPMPAQAVDPLKLYAAGSLKAALGDVAKNYAAAYGTNVKTTFAASGLLRQRIEDGETPHVFASANMKHPETLEAQGKGGPVMLFARNTLCAIAQPGVGLTSETLLDKLLDPAIRVGTSTPKADPSGDYAWQLFARAESLKAGAEKLLQDKALQLTGGPTSKKAPEGRNQYAWVMSENKADVFLTYCTNAVLARDDTPGLEIVTIPEALGVGADYGLIVLATENPDAWRLAGYILSPAGQAVLARYGFEARGTRAK